MTTLQQLISKVSIDTSEIPGQLAAVNQTIGAGLTAAAAQGQAGLNGLRGSFDVLSATEARAEAQTIRTAQAHARALAAEGDRAGGVRVLTQALNDSHGISEQMTYSVQAQIANLERGATAAEGYGAALAGGLTSIVGPAAVATAAIGAVVGAAESFKEAFVFNAQLEANTKSIEIQLNGVRDTGQALAQAQAYAEKYKLTQEEVNEAMVASVPVIRQSTASMEDILGVFDRLQVRQPGKTFSDAARAIGELQAGQYTSLNKIFNVPLEDAHQLSVEIKAGGDAVQLVSQYLTDSGLGMDALRSKTEGAMGALKDYTRQAEAFKIAQGNFAAGPGTGLLGGASAALADATRVLGGDGFGGIFKNFGALASSNAIALQIFSAELGRSGDVERSVAEAAAVRAAIYDEMTGIQTNLTTRTKDDTAIIRENNAANQDRVDVSKLTEQQLQSLQNALETTGDKASDAYAKIGQVQTDYEAKSADAAQAHNQKLSDLQAKFTADLLKIDQTESDARTKATQDWRDRTEKITEDGHRRLVELEDAYTDDIAKKRADAQLRFTAIDADLQLKLETSQRDSQRRIEEIQQSGADTRVQRQQAAADREAAVQDKISTATQDAAQKLATFEQSAADARVAAQASYQDKVVALAQRAADLVIAAQEAASRRSQDLARTDSRAAEDIADRASDQAVDRQNADADRAQQHADRLAAIQGRGAGGGSQGRITTLTGGSFVTQDVAGAAAGGDTVAAQIAAENAKYEAQLAAEQRSQALQDSRAARDAAKAQTRQAEDRARAEQDAQQKLADQQQALAAQAAVLDQDYARQEAKAQAAADKQRAALAQSLQDKIAAIQTAAAQADAAAAKQAAQEDARIALQIAKERAAEATKEADARAAAERQQADLIASTNRALAERQAGYEDARVKEQEAIGRQTQDANNAYAKQLVVAAQRRTEERAAATKAYAEQQNAENAAYAKQEADRARAYAKQKTDAEAAYADQASAYLRAQENIGNITHTEALKREAIIEASFGRQAASQRAAFDAAFGTQTGTAALGARQENLAGIKDAGLIGGSGTSVSIGNITLPSVQNAQQFLDELRGIVVREVRGNGGDANKYWGGTG